MTAQKRHVPSRHRGLPVFRLGPVRLPRPGNAAAPWREPGNSVSLAAASRAPVPGGPATTSGVVRRENWPSRIRNGRPPKWSPCRWVTTTASIVFGSIRWVFNATRLVAPQSISSVFPDAASRMHVCHRPPLPKASPLPTNCTCTTSSSPTTRHPAPCALGWSRCNLRRISASEQRRPGTSSTDRP